MIRRYTAEGLEQAVCELRAVFDLVRVVDPAHMSVEEPHDMARKALKASDYSCFTIWKRDGRCLNCVGLRAVQEGERQSKFKFVDRELFHVIAVPVEIGKRTLALEMVEKADDRLLLSAFGMDEFANRIEALNARFQLDEATGLYSKRYFDDRLPLLCRQALLNKTDVAVAMLDVDGLESLASDYGHQAADEALIAIGRLLTSSVSRRRGDFVVRYGTNTFALVLCDIPALPLRERMAEIVQRLSALRLTGYGNVRLKNAMGVFRLSENRKASMPEIMRIVAQRVEIARAAGLNRIAFHGR